MRCISCQVLSIHIVCKKCQEILLIPVFKKRELQGGLLVYSFYEYEDIKEYINSKYEFYGDRIFNILGKLSFRKFANNFTFTQKIISLSVDDITTHEFSQSAILNSHLKSKHIKPIYNTIQASNKVKYAGKSLEYRQKNKRKFKYTGEKNLKIILVDDIVTTGSTLNEAKNILNKYNCEVLFALTLSDAKV